MENRKKKLSDRPYLFGLVCVVLATIGSYGAASVVTLVGLKLLGGAFGFSSLDMDAKTVLLTRIVQMVVPFLAAVCMYIFYLLNRKNGYRGAIKVRGKNCRDVWVCIAIFAVVTVARYFYGPLTIPDGFSRIDIGARALFLAFCAGISEEIITRGIPLAVMMRGKPEAKRIRTALILTSVVFGVMHLLNGYGGATGPLQVVFTFITGMFMGAVYLRTGSILTTIVFHVIYDIFATTIVLPDPMEMSHILFLLFNELLLLVFAIVLMRKSRIEDIKETWAEVWAE